MRSTPRTHRRTPGAAALIVLILGLGIPLGLGAQDEQTSEPAGIPAGRPVAPEYSIALLINTGSLLLDLEAYGGGIGVKVGRDRNYLRVLADLHASHSPSSGGFTLTLGATFERHFLSAVAVSPYWGAGASLGVRRHKVPLDADNWWAATTVPLGVTGLLGVAVFPIEHISLFVEYALSLDFTITHEVWTLGGTRIPNTYADFLADIGLGNHSKIGIAIQLPVTLRLRERRVRDRPERDRTPRDRPQRDRSQRDRPDRDRT